MVRCPGQDSRKLTVSYHPCPACGYKVEIFSDELEVRCPKCKTWVSKEQTPTCVAWCQAARECVGPERYEAIMKALNQPAEQAKEGQTT